MKKTICLAAALAALTAPGAGAQTYPTKSIRVVVGFAPGGGTDIVARIIGAKLTENWKQSVVVDNRAGATGTIGADIVAKSPPDGYTIILGHVNSHGIAPNLFKKLPYDAQRDFEMVAYVGYVPNVLVVHPSIPAKSAKELIAIARSRPGQLSYASSGVGSTQHLAGEMLKLITSINIIHVPYKGSGPAVVDLLAGHVAMNFDTLPPVLPHVQAGRVRALAVTADKRASVVPDVPTMAELGFKDATGHGRRNSGRPFVFLDWQRLNHGDQAAEEHEMGHAFGLEHICVPGATRQTPTNIMASADCGKGSGGLRNLGFNEQQTATILRYGQQIRDRLR